MGADSADRRIADLMGNWSVEWGLNGQQEIQLKGIVGNEETGGKKAGDE